MESIARDYVGVDPDSKGYQMYQYREGKAPGISRYFKSSLEGMRECMEWLKKLNQPMIGIEGIHGQSQELEKWLKKEGLTYYSIPSFRIMQYRQATLGQNKNNRNDAKAVALFLESSHRQDNLDVYKPKPETDYELRKLTRLCMIKSREETAAKNRLWKIIKSVSADLYLYLSGDTEESDEIRLDKMFMLNLLYSMPNLSRWKEMNNDEWYEAFGANNFKTRERLLSELKNVALKINKQPASTTLAISQLAEDILRLKRHQQAIKKELNELTEDNTVVKYLESLKGIGNYSASCLMAEILDIGRFRNDDALACYSGLGRREHKTGSNSEMKKSMFYNRFLKNTLINSAMLFVKWNKESGFASYYRSLLKKGMKKIEARKRVGRAFLRKIYRELKALCVENTNEKNGMAITGSRPNGLTVHKSNIPSSHIENKRIIAKSQTEKELISQ